MPDSELTNVLHAWVKCSANTAILHETSLTHTCKDECLGTYIWFIFTLVVWPPHASRMRENKPQWRKVVCGLPWAKPLFQGTAGHSSPKWFPSLVTFYRKTVNWIVECILLMYMENQFWLYPHGARRSMKENLKCHPLICNMKLHEGSCRFFRRKASQSTNNLS